jgi:hypothetical protein
MEGSLSRKRLNGIASENDATPRAELQYAVNCYRSPSSLSFSGKGSPLSFHPLAL